MISLYIHIPFCKAKCKYCSFYSKTGDRSSYLSALTKALEYWGGRVREQVGTVYIGGGTPSLMTVRELSVLLESIYKNFDTSKALETTIEANPESISEEFLRAALNVGIDRISLGIQTFDERELSAIGRLHTADEAKNAVTLCFDSGFENISCDLIFGLPYQRVQSFEKNLEILTDFGVPHLSCYNLQVEKGTPLYEQKIPVASEDEQREMYNLACSFLADKGYRHYEISNFAKKGFEAKHNSIYWTGGDYLGIGPAAHSKMGDIRAYFDADIEKFIAKTDFDFDGSERITDPLFEKIMLGLRTWQGVPLSLMPKSKGYIKRLCEGGFATAEDGRLILTDRGFYLSNTIISDITAKEC